MTTARSVLVIALIGSLLLAGCSGATPDTGAETPTPNGQPGATSPDGSATASAPNGTLAVHFINVGQSVSTLIVGPTGETMLIDTGHYNDNGEYVLEYLQRHDIDRIDYLVSSHGDADHIGGNAAIIEYYETEADGIGAIYDPGIVASTQTYERYLDAVEEHDVTLYETRAGDSIPLEGVEVDVLGPPEPYLENEARNENSIVLKLSFGATSVLLTGDAEDDQEQYLVDTYGDRLQATIFKAGHHGSRSSTSAALLDAVDPRVVAISSAYDSQYGHPHEEVLQRLDARSIRTYWTATHGTIVFRSDGEQVTVATQQTAPTGPQSLRDGNPIEPGTTTPVTPRLTLSATGDATTTPVVTDGGTATPAQTGGELAVAEISADAAGDDRDNLNDEYIVFTNEGSDSLDLSGWTVSDAAGATYTIPEGVTLAPGEELTLHTGSGSDTKTDLYWGSGQPIWNNDGDTITVTNTSGEQVLQETYS